MTPPSNTHGPLELLAPAGDGEAMRAAVANGAEAIYFGLQEFNARRRAANFTLEGLPQIVDQLHGWNVKAYVTLNTLVFADELDRAARCIAGIAEAGADALIVQDLGVLRLARTMCPALPVHASTQMTQTHAGGIGLLRELGVSRVILARELSLADIAAIRRETDVELEAFVHGALCVSYSGQCLASESLFGRSANRGLCAQPCRLPYQLVVDGEPRELPGGPHLLSPKDLATYARIPELIAAGVTGFKIEGRLKSAQYVAAATNVYRAAIDAALNGRPFAPSEQQRSDLEQSFSRGFTAGFLDGNRHQSLIERSSPKSRGVRIGTVTDKSGRGVTVRLDAQVVASRDLPVKPGDGVAFEAEDSESQMQGGRVYSVEPERNVRSATEARAAGPGRNVRSASPERTARGWRPAAHKFKPTTHGDTGAGVLLTFGSGDLDLASVRVGAVVWKTDDPQTRRRIEQTYSRVEPARRSPLSVRARLLDTGQLCLRFIEGLHSDAAGDASERQAAPFVEVSSSAPLALADRRPLTLELLREQMGRLGETPFELGEVELLGPSGRVEALPVLAPKSVLNDLRRQAVTQLLEVRRTQARKPVQAPDALAQLRAQAHLRTRASQNAAPAQAQGFESLGLAMRGEGATKVLPTIRGKHDSVLHVLVRTTEQLEAVLEFAQKAPCFGMLYCDFQNLAATRKAAAACRTAGAAFALATPRILKPKEEALLNPLIALAPDALLVRNLTALRHVATVAPQLPLIGDFTLNTANDLTAKLLLDAGLARVTTSCDLNLSQLAAMLQLAAMPENADAIATTNPASEDIRTKGTCSRESFGTMGTRSHNLEVVVHQHIPMFHTAYCLAAACVGTADDCRGCDRPCERFDLELRDRLGIDHPLLTDPAGRCTIFNARPQSAAELWPELTRLGLGHYRIELLREPAGETHALLSAYDGLLSGQATPREAVARIAALYPQGITPGTFAFREREPDSRQPARGN
jgi:U32 family peptidase